jgi:hypothetical protein
MSRPLASMARADDRASQRAQGEALIPAFGELPLAELTSQMIAAFPVALVEEGRLGPRTINKYFVPLNGIVKRAQRP